MIKIYELEAKGNLCFEFLLIYETGHSSLKGGHWGIKLDIRRWKKVDIGE